MVLLTVSLFSAARGPWDRVGVGGDTRHAASSCPCSTDSPGFGGAPQGKLWALWSWFYVGQRSEALASRDQCQPYYGLLQHCDCAALSCCASRHAEGCARLEDWSQRLHRRLQAYLQTGWTGFKANCCLFPGYFYLTMNAMENFVICFYFITFSGCSWSSSVFGSEPASGRSDHKEIQTLQTVFYL